MTGWLIREGFLLLLCGLSACASPCLWEDESCLVIDLMGDGALQEGRVSLRLDPRKTVTPGTVPGEIHLPRTLTMTLPAGVNSSDVTGISFCAPALGLPGSYVGATDVLWPAGAKAEISLALERRMSAACAPQTEKPAEPVREPRFQHQKTPLSSLAPLGGAVLGDFFDANRRDLALVRTSARELLLLAARGDGTFGTSTSYPDNRIPDKLLAADVSGDGRSDLIGPSSSQGIVLEYIRDGASPGRLGSRRVGFTEQGSAPSDVTFCDLNRDGKPELILSNTSQTTPSEVIVIPSNGTSMRRYPSGGISAEAIAAADLNGDGWCDVLATNRVSGETLLLVNDGSGSGGLLTGPKVAQCTGPVALEVSDFNNDGRLDVALLCAGDATVQLMLAAAPGGPPLFGTTLSLPVESRPRRLASLDVNQDGTRDLAVLHESGRLLFLLGDGVGGFNTWPAPDAFGRDPLVLLADDQNGDGLRDLLIVDQEAAHSLIVY